MKDKPQYFYYFDWNGKQHTRLCEHGDYQDKWTHPEHKRCTKRATKVSKMQVLFATRVGPLGDEEIMTTHQHFYCDGHFVEAL